MSRSVAYLTQLFRDIRHTLGIRSHEKNVSKVLVGSDEHGNKYYTREGNPAKNIKPKRWVEALDPDPTLVPKVPIHWDAWLRGRRDDVPSEEEVARVAQRVELGKQMDARARGEVPDHTALPSKGKKTPFPTYDDIHPGTGPKRD